MCVVRRKKNYLIAPMIGGEITSPRICWKKMTRPQDRARRGGGMTDMLTAEMGARKVHTHILPRKRSTITAPRLLVMLIIRSMNMADGSVKSAGMRK